VFPAPGLPPSKKPSTSAGYGTPWIATLPLPILDFKALKKGGPTKTPTLPGSVVPRAQMTVTALQEPERSFCVVEVPVTKASVSSAAMRRLEMSWMRPLKGQRLAISARKELISREMSSSVGVGEVIGAVKTREMKERARRNENEVFIFSF
jgi:hypothetical protein